MIMNVLNISVGLTVTGEHHRLCDEVSGDDKFNRKFVVRYVSRTWTNNNTWISFCVINTVLRLNSIHNI